MAIPTAAAIAVHISSSERARRTYPHPHATGTAQARTRGLFQTMRERLATRRQPERRSKTEELIFVPAPSA